MAPARSFRQNPNATRQRGLPAIGFEVLPPDELEVTPVAEGPTLIRCRQAGVGELELAVFGGGLIIDREGALESKASSEAGAPAVRVSLPGARGYRANAVVDGEVLPYLYVFAVAPRDIGIDAGVLVTVRCVGPSWPAAEAMLHSLRLITRIRHPTVPANDDSGVTPVPLPLIGRKDE